MFGTLSFRSSYVTRTLSVPAGFFCSGRGVPLLLRGSGMPPAIAPPANGAPPPPPIAFGSIGLVDSMTCMPPLSGTWNVSDWTSLPSASLICACTAVPGARSLKKARPASSVRATRGALLTTSVTSAPITALPIAPAITRTLISPTSKSGAGSGWPSANAGCACAMRDASSPKLNAATASTSAKRASRRRLLCRRRSRLARSRRRPGVGLGRLQRLPSRLPRLASTAGLSGFSFGALRIGRRRDAQERRWVRDIVVGHRPAHR